jgi:hypothetical protein
MTRASRNISLTQDHYDLLLRVTKERHVLFSEALRCIIDFVIDHDATLGLPVLANREKLLQAELLTVQEARKKLEQERKPKITEAPNRVFKEVNSSVNDEARSGSRASFVDKRHAETEHERWQRKLPYLLEPKGLQKEQQQKVMDAILNEAVAHPDWVTGETGETKIMLLRLLDADKRRGKS